MKKIIKIIAVSCSLLVISCFTACESETETLIMGTEAGFAPYEYYDGDEIVGIDVDIAKEIASDLGVELEIQDMTFDSVLTSVATGKVDFGCAGISITEERMESMDFSIEYTTSRQVVIVLEDSDLTDPEEVVNVAVGVQTGTTADIVLTYDYDDVDISRYNKYLEAVEDLKAGRIDAVVMDSLPAENILAVNDGLVILDDELFTDVYAIAVQKDNTEMLESINATLERLIEEGKIEEFTTTHMENQLSE